MAEKPYLVYNSTTVFKRYNPNYGDDRMCKCGHPYYRHFDTWDGMKLVGCKYCDCWEFEEPDEKDPIYNNK